MPYDENGKCQINDGYYIISLETFNLLNPNASLETMIIQEMGLKDNVIKQYEAMTSLK